MATKMYTDKALTCVDCSQEFIWTAGEQQFFEDKGLEHIPKRCKPCKAIRKERIAAHEEAQRTGAPKPQVRVQVVCAECNQPTEVPFYPSQGRPVYCRPCHKARQA